jgi:hypothetical protein
VNEKVGVFFIAAITYTMSAANLILNAFQSSFTMDLSGVIHSQPAVTALDVSANATIHVDLGAMRNIFTYHTDSADVINTPSTDLLFYVNSDSTADPKTGFAGPALINPANALVDTSYIYNESNTSKRLVCHDFVRYLSSKLFNTHYAADLFENEQELIDHLRTLSNDASGHVWGNIIDVANAVNTAQIYSDDDANICCQIFRQIITQFPARFADITVDCVDAIPIASSQYYIPFIENDTIQFKLTISAAPGQETITGVSAIGDRSYSITLLLKETANIANPAVVDDTGAHSFV